MLRAVIFDLDDTLYPERGYVVSGFRSVASWAERTLGIPAEGSLLEMERLLEQGIRGTIFDLWMNHHGVPSSPWLAQAVAVYRDHSPNIAPYPGVEDLLTALSAKFRLGLLSDGHLAVQRRKLDALELEHHFDVVVFSDELGRDWWKPSTRPFERLIDLLQIRAEESVYVGENSAKDFLGARQIGMHTVRVLGPPGFYTSVDPPSSKHAAELEIEDLRQLELVLQECWLNN